MLREFLQAICDAHNPKSTWRYSGIEAAIMAEGFHFDGSVSKPFWLPPGPRGFCYSNATDSVTDNNNLRYVEGYALFKGIPLAHAWVYDVSTGEYYDPTWEQEGSEYFGVVFNTEFLLEFLVRSEHYGIWASQQYDLLQEYMENGFPETAILKI